MWVEFVFGWFFATRVILWFSVLPLSMKPKFLNNYCNFIWRVEEQPLCGNATEKCNLFFTHNGPVNPDSHLNWILETCIGFCQEMKIRKPGENSCVRARTRQQTQSTNDVGSGKQTQAT